MNFAEFTDIELHDWLWQYAGRQAGFYPGLRRTRLRAEREATRRGVAWFQAPLGGDWLLSTIQPPIGAAHRGLADRLRAARGWLPLSASGR